MKLQNMLCIISLLSIAAIDAKITGGRPAGYEPSVTPPSSSAPAQQQPKPIEVKRAPVTNKFQSLLQKIRSSNVISANGEISAELIQEVQDTDLAPEQKQALLQAAVTVKLPLTAANNDDTVGMINRAMAQAGGAMKEGREQQPQREIVTEAFYNPKTNLFDRLFLDNQVKFAQADNLTQTGAEKSLMSELMPMITNAWKKRNIAVSIGQVDAARQQIITAIAQGYKVSPQIVNPAEGWDKEYWYDRQRTHLIKQNILDEEVETVLKDPKNKNISIPVLTNNLMEQYLDVITDLWKQDRLNVNEYNRKLYNQIKDTFTKVKKAQPIAQPAQEAPVAQKPAEKTYEEEAIMAISGNRAEIKEEIIQSNNLIGYENVETAIANLLEAKPDLVGKGNAIKVANIISDAFAKQGDALLPAEKGKLIKIIYDKFPGLK